MNISHKTVLFSCTALFTIFFVILGIAPYDRSTWALENVLVFAFLFLLLVTHKKIVLSRITYSLIFLFLFLHEIGCHYTYSKVPYEQAFMEAFHFSINGFMGWQRNNFDRFVHFFYGLLLAYPIRELYCRVAYAKGFWAYFFPLELTMASSMLYELLEWAAAEIFGGDLSISYLGSQGDIWDAQKDMALASVGAFIAMALTFLLNLFIQKDFWKEWKESLSVKGKYPLGEDEIERMINEKI